MGDYKKRPDYPLPEGMTPLEEEEVLEECGVMFDNEGNFYNGFSYVVVNIVAENKGDRPTKGYEFTWHWFRLSSVGILSNVGCSQSKEIVYLGEENPRKYSPEYLLETLYPNEPKEMVLIYCIDDKMLKGDGFCLKVNHGVGIPDDRIYKYFIANSVLMLE